MTALVLLYLLHFQKVDMDNEDYTFDTQKFIELSKDKAAKETIQNKMNNITKRIKAKEQTQEQKKEELKETVKEQ
jgi:hypothetical protein